MRYKFKMEKGKWLIRDGDQEQQWDVQQTKDVEKLIEWMNDQQDLIQDLNEENQRLINVIIQEKDKKADLKKKLNDYNYVIVKQKQLLRIYSDIWEYIEIFKGDFRE